MIYKTFKADSVISALIAIDEIIENLDDRYSHQFSNYNIHVIRLILEVDYDCPSDIIEDAVKSASNDNLFEYQPHFLDLI